MANRFLETNYYKSAFVRGLKGSLKGLYSFIICDCSPAGIWNKDIEAASLYIGFEVTDDEFYESFVLTGKAIDIGRGKFFFPDFIEHQYPKGLQDNNTAHKNIIFELKKIDFLDENLQLKVKKNKAPSKPLQSSTGNGIGYDKVNNLKDSSISKLWFLKFYHSNYENYKSTYNGQSATEIKFKEWKKFIDFIYKKKYEELFECKFISPHDFAKLVDFTEDKWDEVLKKILSTGIKPEHNLFFRIPEFMNYAKKSTGTNNQTLTGNKFSTGQDKLLAKGKQVYADITGKQST